MSVFEFVPIEPGFSEYCKKLKKREQDLRAQFDRLISFTDGLLKEVEDSTKRATEYDELNVHTDTMMVADVLSDAIKKLEKKERRIRKLGKDVLGGKIY